MNKKTVITILLILCFATMLSFCSKIQEDSLSKTEVLKEKPCNELVKQMDLETKVLGHETEIFSDLRRDLQAGKITKEAYFAKLDSRRDIREKSVENISEIYHTVQDLIKNTHSE